MDRTRREIAEAAMDLIARDGYAATTMAAIADAAGVSRRTVFRYFADKEEVVFADDPAHTELLLATVDRQAPGTPPLEVLRAAGRALAEELGRGRKETARWAAFVATEPALHARYLAKQRRWERLLAERLAARGAGPAGSAGEGGSPSEGGGAGAAGGADAAAAPIGSPALAAKVGVACLQAAFDAWLADPGRDLPARVDEAFDALPALVAAGRPGAAPR